MGEGRGFMIEFYGFGKVVIDGEVYSSDVIVFPDRVKAGWWRKEGHRLHIEDLNEVVAEKPEVVVVGTGYVGLMKVPDEVRVFLEEQGIELVVERTKKACKIFNDLLKSGRKVVAVLHLTC